MTMALLVGLIGSGIAAMLTPLIIVQIGTSTFDGSRARETNAAEAGIYVALGLIRSAADDSGNGDVRLLPCTTTPLTGSVDASAGQLSYRVRIGYYTQNPVNQPAAWLARYNPVTGQGHGMFCANGSGTYYPAGAPGNDSGTALQVPSWAVITATGIDARGNRTMRAIYTVMTTNANIAGGTMHLWNNNNDNRCMDAGPVQAAGVNVGVQPCVPSNDPANPSAADPSQAWVYRSDLSIQLVSSVSPTVPNGLCLDVQPLGNPPAPHNGAPVVLEPCSKLGHPSWHQQWSINDSGDLEAALSTSAANGALSNLCMSPVDGTDLVLTACGTSSDDSKQTWVLSSDVGSGMAGQSSNQYVNFQNPSYCMDVTNQNVTGGTDSWPAGNNFLIAFPCKQNPSSCAVLWNQQFTMVGHHLVTYNKGNNANSCGMDKAQPYCLYAPSTPTGYVTVVSCKDTTHLDPSRLTWTQYGPTNDDGSPRTQYKYAVVNSDGSSPPDGVGSGLCLSLSQDSAVAWNGWAKLIIEPCNGHKIQMWNASPDVQPPKLIDFGESSVPVTP